MAFVAADLEEAIANTNIRVRLGVASSVLLTQIGIFTEQFPAQFNATRINDRTVLDWRVQSTLITQKTADIPPGTANVQQRQDVVNVACRVMYATLASFAAGRIMASQRDSVLDAWNNSFGANP